ncbi:sigma-70 family RNA polymerase sigma factor [Imperialibacter roseus]|uniref:Sigma-70 family RNA polymerase sigma factor n=1 Tax=Imperialibacter roseus TaxID=1324217 RepID=A0ABZ0IQ93_9BACT|nr:sigma-70 family RNA polymerase sigma factor [Imperialibacter roseus]WOK07213.1 sigma-70 family RNA polymerase sigma factor [Imperialibacter roseus]
MEKSDNVCKEKVFNQVFVDNAKDLFNFLHFKYQDEDEAKDLVQEAFGKLWDNCNKVTIEKARGFLFVCANNLMKNNLSKKNTALKHQPDLKVDESSKENPQYLMEESEFEDKLNRALQELPEEQRVTLLLKRIEGKKQKEIAEMLGISEKAVEKRLYKAMNTLREKLGNIL